MQTEALLSYSLPALALGVVTALVSTANAASPAIPNVSPMPFRAGELVAVSATLSGPFTNAAAYVSVTDGTTMFFQRNVKDLGAVASGQSRKYTFKDKFSVPVDQVKGLSIFVVFLEGGETWVGEPGTKSLNLISHCPAKDKPTVQGPCRYATARYWAMTKAK